MLFSKIITYVPFLTLIAFFMPLDYSYPRKGDLELPGMLFALILLRIIRMIYSCYFEICILYLKALWSMVGNTGMASAFSVLVRSCDYRIPRTLRL